MFMSPRRAFNQCEAIVTGMFALPSAAGHLPFGFSNDTRVETPDGLQQVDRLCEGDAVRSTDGRFRPVRRIMRRTYGAEIASAYPEGLVLISKGAFGLTGDVYLTPEQPLCLAAPGNSRATRAGVAILRARNLVDRSAAQYVLPVDGFTITRPIFDQGTHLRIEAGLTLLCPAVRERPRVLSDSAAQLFLDGLEPAVGVYPATHPLPLVA